jgi:hypothetical protein
MLVRLKKSSLIWLAASGPSSKLSTNSERLSLLAGNVAGAEAFVASFFVSEGLLN